MASIRQVVVVMSALTLAWTVGLSGPPPAVAAGLVVTSTDDVDDGACAPAPGHCSLREAINAANASAGPDSITFDIPGAGVHVIQPASELPEITDPVSIDGYSQTGASPNTDLLTTNAVLRIQLDGSLTDTADGLRITGGGSTVRGLIVTNFVGPQPSLSGGDARTAGMTLMGGGNNVIAGNFIGTDATGLVGAGNRTGVVIVGSSDNLIGGPTLEDRNLISGNLWGGIYVRGPAGFPFDPTERNEIVGNHIGLDATGDGLLANATTESLGSAVLTTLWLQGADDGLVAGNVVATRDFLTAVRLACCSDDNVVRDNLVGLNTAGNALLGSSGTGIEVRNAQRNVIGGSFDEGNVVGGAQWQGISVDGSCEDCARDNVIVGNAVGTDRTGSLDLGNDEGIHVSNGPRTVIGLDGGAEWWGNLVAGNRLGIVIGTGHPARSTQMWANRIGTSSLGNDEAGVLVRSNVDGVRFEALGPSSANEIVGNGGAGIELQSAPGSDPQGVFVAAHTVIRDNGGLGIELGADGVTANDPLDADSGPNGLQNYPVIGSAASSEYTGTTVVSGTLESTPELGFHLVVRASPACDPSGHGEGASLLAAGFVTTDAGGQANFTFVGATLPVGHVLTATATSGADGSTSEFSACVSVAALDSDGDGIPDDLEVELGTDPDSADTDGDGIPDGEDVEFIQSAVEDLPIGVFGNAGDPEGQRNAILSRLDEIEAMIAAGDEAGAIRALENLRRKVDGCASATGMPDRNDWIVDCAAQIEIRDLIDLLIANLMGGP